MHKFLQIVGGVFVALVVITPSAFAQTSSESANPLIPRETNKKLNTLRDEMAQKVERVNTLGPQRQASPSASSQKRLQFQERLTAIKDAEKQAIIEKIDQNITTLNASETAKLNEKINKISNVLDRISSEAAQLKAEGANTVALDNTIKSANVAINNAQTAVNTQSQKEYVITIGTERTLKTNTGATVSQFRNDMRTTRQSVIAARSAVVRSATELIKLTTSEIVDTATGSARPATNSARPASPSAMRGL